jgi:hypothetical protein
VSTELDGEEAALPVTPYCSHAAIAIGDGPHDRPERRGSASTEVSEGALSPEDA